MIRPGDEGEVSAEGSWRGTVPQSGWGGDPSSGIHRSSIDVFKDEVDFTGIVPVGPEDLLTVAFTLPPIPAEDLAEPVPEPSARVAWGVGALAGSSPTGVASPGRSGYHPPHAGRPGPPHGRTSTDRRRPTRRRQSPRGQTS